MGDSKAQLSNNGAAVPVSHPAGGRLGLGCPRRHGHGRTGTLAAHLQAQAFAEIQLQAVDGEIKDVVTEEGMGALDIRLA